MNCDRFLAQSKRTDSLFQEQPPLIPLPENTAFSSATKSYKVFGVSRILCEPDRGSMSNGSSPSSMSASSSSVDSVASLTPVATPNIEPTQLTQLPESQLHAVQRPSQFQLGTPSTSSGSFRHVRDSGSSMSLHTKVGLGIGLQPSRSGGPDLRHMNGSTNANGGVTVPSNSSAAASGSSFQDRIAGTNTNLTGTPVKRHPLTNPLINLLEQFTRPMTSPQNSHGGPATATVLLQLQGRSASNGSQSQTTPVTQRTLFPLQAHPHQLNQSGQQCQTHQVQLSQAQQSQSHPQQQQQQHQQHQQQAALTMKLLSLLQNAHSNQSYSAAVALNGSSNGSFSSVASSFSNMQNGSVSPCIQPLGAAGQIYRAPVSNYRVPVTHIQPPMGIVRSLSRSTFGASATNFIPPANGVRIPGSQHVSLLDDDVADKFTVQNDTVRAKPFPPIPSSGGYQKGGRFTRRMSNSEEPLNESKDASEIDVSDLDTTGQPVLGTRRRRPSQSSLPSAQESTDADEDEQESEEDHAQFLQQLELAEKAYDSAYLAEQAQRAHSSKRGFKKLRRPIAKAKIVNLKRVCMACSTKNSSYWREPWVGACLCNACALRYKKRGVACSKCMYVPFKEDSTQAPCPRCKAEFIAYGVSDDANPSESPSVTAEEPVSEPL